MTQISKSLIPLPFHVKITTRWKLSTREERLNKKDKIVFHGGTNINLQGKFSSFRELRTQHSFKQEPFLELSGQT